MINQITKTLPKTEWEGVFIHENNEPLIEVRETDRLKISLVSKTYTPLFFVRKTVAEKLYRVSEKLPKGISLALIEGYRTMKAQQENWDRAFKQIKARNQNWTDEEIERQVRLVVAKPLPLANHHCGGAVDVTLTCEDGTLIDMGTLYISQAPEEDRLKFPMFSEGIIEDQKANRKILREAMETEDFVWYPGEWWHYCWGDRMWAVYSGQTECWYGSIEIEA